MKGHAVILLLSLSTKNQHVILRSHGRVHFIYIGLLYFLFSSPYSAGELKATKAYEKWAKEVSETKPPTNPLRRRNK